jgi:hypothetical protein
MSKEIKVSFQINSIGLMKKTLADLSISYNEVNEERLEIDRRWHPIVINYRSNEISCDDMDQAFVNNIQKNYTLNAYRDKAIREGVRLQEEVTATGEIHLTIL